MGAPRLRVRNRGFASLSEVLPRREGSLYRRAINVCFLLALDS